MMFMKELISNRRANAENSAWPGYWFWQAEKKISTVTQSPATDFSGNPI